MRDRAVRHLGGAGPRIGAARNPGPGRGAGPGHGRPRGRAGPAPGRAARAVGPHHARPVPRGRVSPAPGRLARPRRHRRRYREAADITDPNMVAGPAPQSHPELLDLARATLRALEIRTEDGMVWAMTRGQLEATVAHYARVQANRPSRGVPAAAGRTAGRSRRPGPGSGTGRPRGPPGSPGGHGTRRRGRRARHRPGRPGRGLRPVGGRHGRRTARSRDWPGPNWTSARRPNGAPRQRPRRLRKPRRDGRAGVLAGPVPPGHGKPGRAGGQTGKRGPSGCRGRSRWGTGRCRRLARPGGTGRGLR